MTNKTRPGPKKGVPRKPKRTLDGEFPARFKAAMANHPEWDLPALSKETGCTRQVLHKYLKGQSRTIEALLLDAIARKLEVSAGWLLTGQGSMARPQTLNPDQVKALDILSRLADRPAREFWFTQGEQIIALQPALWGDRHDPYRLGVPDGPRHLHEPSPTKLLDYPAVPPRFKKPV